MVDKDKSEAWHKNKQWKGGMKGGGGGGNAVYGLGFIGALIFYFHEAIGFGAYVTGFLKAIVWPAYLVYHLFMFLHL